jgi:hypothetical protein
MDFKVRNIGDRVAYIKSIIFHVVRVANLLNPAMRMETHVDISWTYDVSLRLVNFPYDRSVATSQMVRPDEVDRFEVRLAYDERAAESLFDRLVREAAAESVATGKPLDEMPPVDKFPIEMQYAFLLERARLFSVMVLNTELIYNEDSKKVATGQLMFIMPRINCYIMATEVALPNAKEIVEKNKATLSNFVKNFDGKKSAGILAQLTAIGEGRDNANSTAPSKSPAGPSP